mmetsp:Transcript_81776/g.144302  ORF Transcript_81776/g.144302 Transcript_81776/m.144302 type:complete len:88 (+) Transcript_81776:235-498(+)
MVTKFTASHASQVTYFWDQITAVLHPAMSGTKVVRNVVTQATSASNLEVLGTCWVPPSISSSILSPILNPPIPSPSLSTIQSHVSSQ